MRFSRQRILEWVAISSYSRGSSTPGFEPESLTSPALAGGFFITASPFIVPFIFIISKATPVGSQRLRTPGVEERVRSNPGLGLGSASNNSK